MRQPGGCGSGRRPARPQGVGGNSAVVAIVPDADVVGPPRKGGQGNPREGSGSGIVVGGASAGVYLEIPEGAGNPPKLDAGNASFQIQVQQLCLIIRLFSSFPPSSLSAVLSLFLPL